MRNSVLWVSVVVLATLAATAAAGKTQTINFNEFVWPGRNGKAIDRWYIWKPLKAYERMGVKDIRPATHAPPLFPEKYKNGLAVGVVRNRLASSCYVNDDVKADRYVLSTGRNEQGRSMGRSAGSIEIEFKQPIDTFAFEYQTLADKRLLVEFFSADGKAVAVPNSVVHGKDARDPCDGFEGAKRVVGKASYKVKDVTRVRVGCRTHNTIGTPDWSFALRHFSYSFADDAAVSLLEVAATREELDEMAALNALQVETRAETAAETASEEEWDAANSASIFKLDSLEYNYDELVKQKWFHSGVSDVIPWPESYFPYYKDGFNVRHHTESDLIAKNVDQLSPMEKLDLVQGHKPAAGHLKGQPFVPKKADCNAVYYRTAEAAYYGALGPAARWQSYHRGNGRARNGVDDDGDGLVDECNDYDGIETWTGFCHAWSPASVVVPEPEVVVKHKTEGAGEVTLYPSDLKALVMQDYHKSKYWKIGGNCAKKFGAARGSPNELTKDAYGRMENRACRDTNAGTFHVIMANLLGRDSRPFLIDRTTDYEKWNQPVFSFHVKYYKEYAREQESEVLKLLGAPSNMRHRYAFNDKAKRFVYVVSELQYVKEPATGAKTPNLPQLTNYMADDEYTYVLELDAEGRIIGGEWKFYSKRPDYLWLPSGTKPNENPHVKRDLIYELVARSQTDERATRTFEVHPSESDKVVKRGSGWRTFKVPVDWKAAKQLSGRIEVSLDVARAPSRTEDQKKMLFRDMMRNTQLELCHGSFCTRLPLATLASQYKSYWGTRAKKNPAWRLEGSWLNRAVDGEWHFKVRSTTFNAPVVINFARLHLTCATKQPHIRPALPPHKVVSGGSDTTLMDQPAHKVCGMTINEVLWDAAHMTTHDTGYVELVNTALSAVNMKGFQLVEGAGHVLHTFGDVNVAPGASLLLLARGFMGNRGCPPHLSGLCELTTGRLLGVPVTPKKRDLFLVAPNGGETADMFTFEITSATKRDRSFVRSVDGDCRSPVVRHPVHEVPSGDLIGISPGRRSDLTSTFAGNGNAPSGTHTLSVFVASGSALSAKLDANDGADVFCQVEHGEQTASTMVRPNDDTPQWEEQLSPFAIDSTQDKARIVMRCYDEDVDGSGKTTHQIIGSAAFNAKLLAVPKYENKAMTVMMNLKHQGKATGKIRTVMTLRSNFGV